MDTGLKKYIHHYEKKRRKNLHLRNTSYSFVPYLLRGIKNRPFFKPIATKNIVIS